MKIIQVVGARPNFMKVAPLHRTIQQTTNWTSKIVHTGQHFDSKMSDVFFTQLELPKPDFFLGIGPGSHTQVTANIMLAFEEVLINEKPDLVIVVGDVTSTLACTLVAVKAGIKVAHIEAGLRSFDRTMPEELNRILTDSVSDFLFVTEESGLVNLKREGVDESKIFFTGNVMIDSLVRYHDKSAHSTILGDLDLTTKNYITVTMHRPANVDTEQGLSSILDLLELCTQRIKVVFPIHPRTRVHIEKYGLTQRLNAIPNLVLTEPLGYIEFLQLMTHSLALLTDSGGIQEETTYLGIPCLTFRNSTERPVTVSMGTNILLADLNAQNAFKALELILNGKIKQGTIPPFWDGKSAQRIVKELQTILTR